MADGAPYKYASSLAFRAVDPYTDGRRLIAFGRDLYVESLGDARGFERDYGPGGARFPAWIASCASRGLAAFLTEDGRPIGLVVLGLDERDPALGRVHHFYVVPSHRGRGFGGLLDDYARAALAQAGRRRARLNVTARNRRARRFYKAQGWVDIGPSGEAALRFLEVAL
ncbi:MAG: N-acetyltransferase family protein [Amphiplicatus sp.]